MDTDLIIIRITYASTEDDKFTIQYAQGLNSDQVILARRAVKDFLKHKNLMNAVDHFIALPAGQADVALPRDKVDALKAVCEETMDIEYEFTNRDIITRKCRQSCGRPEVADAHDTYQKFLCYSYSGVFIKTGSGLSLHEKRCSELEKRHEEAETRLKHQRELEKNTEIARAQFVTMSHYC